MSIHITKEAMKAETALRRIRKNAAASLKHHRMAWIAREDKFVKNLPAEVQKVLMVSGVVDSVRCFNSEDPASTEEAIAIGALSSLDEETVEEAELLS